MIDYEAALINTDGSFPDTEAVNVSAPGGDDGTEFVAALVNDIWGRAQALMDYANLTPDGAQEAPDTAQILLALGKGFAIGPGMGVTYWKNDTPAAWGDRVLLLQGQVIEISSYPLLVEATYVGDANNATAAAFYKTSDAGGTTRSTAGSYFVLPDARGLSLKMIGDATVNGRTKTGPTELGEKQEDQGQGYALRLIYDNVAAPVWGQDFNDPTSVSGGANVGTPVTTTTNPVRSNDGVNGTPRTGTNTRDSVLGTNFGITY